MAHEYSMLIWDESEDLAGLLKELDDDAFDAPSLCEGWRVRDVVSHMIVGHTTSMPQILLGIAKYRGNIPKGSFEMTKAYATEHTPDEIRETWARIAHGHTRKGISRTIPYTEDSPTTSSISRTYAGRSTARARSTVNASPRHSTRCRGSVGC